MNPFTRVCAFLLLFAAAGLSLAQSDQKPLRLLPPGSKVAVVLNGSSGGAEVDRALTDMLTAALRQSGMRVVERVNLDAILKEQNLTREGIVDPATAAPTGKLLGADYLITAKATEFGVRDDRIGGGFGLGDLGGLQVRNTTARVVIDARLLDVATGSVLVTSNGEGRQGNSGLTLIGGTLADGRIRLGAIDIGSREWSQSMLGKASRKAVDALIKKLAGQGMAPEGRVLTADDNFVYIDIGSFDGLKVGARLTVVRLETVKDSKGTPVWTEEKVVGELRVVEVRGDRAKAERIGDTNAQEGDIVKAAKGG